MSPDFLVNVVQLAMRFLASLMLLGACAMADTPTIQNNDFEMPVIGPPYVSSVAVPGWLHSGPTGLGTLCRAGYTDDAGTATTRNQRLSSMRLQTARGDVTDLGQSGEVRAYRRIASSFAQAKR